MALDRIKAHYASLDKAREVIKLEEKFSLREVKDESRRWAAPRRRGGGGGA